MPLKKPLPLLVPQRMRTIPQSFAWIDHRLRSEGFLPQLLPEDFGLYLFLVLAADQQGFPAGGLIASRKPCRVSTVTRFGMRDRDWSTST